MAKNYFDRYIWLIDLVHRSGHISFEEIDRSWQFSHYNKTRERLPQRTFFNHLDAIYDIFRIEIKCDRSLGYYIANTDDLEGDDIRQWLLESLSLNNLLNETRDMRNRILLEKIPSSQKWLSAIVNAMRYRKAIEITYKSFWRDEESTFVAYPYCLKLFKQRWYMLATSAGVDDLWIYALDERMINVVQTEEKYSIPKKFDAEEFFSNYFGVIIGTDWEPQEVKIKVVNSQVRYFDTLPLHISQQKVEEESDEEYTVYKYHLAPTHDFKKEIMSWGPDVEVLSPEDFRQEIKDAVAYMSEQYSR
ncbi:MAG: WYL domain-containing protein [Bacteroidales bacterium]|nr:WYL domain-containing protein [Bacteroidales bacterium]